MTGELTSPLHDRHAAAGAKFAEFGGWLMPLEYDGVLADAFAPFIAPYAPGRMHVADRLLPPGDTHWFGTDEFGRDIFSRVLAGSRNVLLIAPAATLLGTVLGTILGLVLGESVLLSLFGGLLGIGVFVAAFPGFRQGLLNSPMGGFASGMRLFPGILALGFGVTLLVGLLSGLVPAIRSAQRPIADGLRQVG